ncbi:hypothetical protein G8V07_14670 [Clostridium botulinum D/C]|uniref:hypothetical protein n=1 Tax=Clostridium botulinum TaxID=1491 RepID=UPI001E2D9556|nr:hypothetical protein [Clostridium botulinum]MCD3321686.1 hypothetical protein [Clostridium botulinum D/C]MCD3324967.1 hypothetical protein [Clostridium botulinum D/C]MCD3327745.1 hypothetical protein [Clostridium botulinum D/C]
MNNINQEKKQIKEKFMYDLVSKLEGVNKRRLREGKGLLDICFMTSIIDTKILQYDEFINNLKYKYFIEEYKEDETGFENGSINVQIRKDKPVTYTICFKSYYIEDICESIPSFEFSKQEYIGETMWDIFEDESYSEYREKFTTKYQNIHSEFEREEKLRQKKELQDKIALLTQQLSTIGV